MLQDNGFDYHILVDAVKHIRHIPGMLCEIGLREGGGSRYMIDALAETGDVDRVHIAVDPYGGIDYIQSEDVTRVDAPYDNVMMMQALLDLYAYVRGQPVTVLFFPLEDTEFFKRYADGVPVYRNQQKEILTTYACTYLDGPHNLEHTMLEAKFFAERSVNGSVIVFDDIDKYYDHGKVMDYLLSIGWAQLHYAPSKISYINKN